MAIYTEAPISIDMSAALDPETSAEMSLNSFYANVAALYLRLPPEEAQVLMDIARFRDLGENCPPGEREVLISVPGVPVSKLVLYMSGKLTPDDPDFEALYDAFSSVISPKADDSKATP